jgi:hypothetical protein
MAIEPLIHQGIALFLLRKSSPALISHSTLYLMVTFLFLLQVHPYPICLYIKHWHSPILTRWGSSLLKAGPPCSLFLLHTCPSYLLQQAMDSHRGEYSCSEHI